jgi:hypothetical protein
MGLTCSDEQGFRYVLSRRKIRAAAGGSKRKGSSVVGRLSSVNGRLSAIGPQLLD